MIPKQLFLDKYSRIKNFLLTNSQERTNEDLIDIRNILESFPLFIQFTKYLIILLSTKSQDFIEMCKYLMFEHFDHDSVIFKQGDIADKFFVILKGQVKIVVNVAENETKQVGTSSVGECFGELALLFHSNRNATIITEQETDLMVLHKDDFKKYMKFRSSEHASHAYNLLNVIEPFMHLSFPDKIRLASKMEYKTFPSNFQFINQGQTLNNFYFIETGAIKLYRNLQFNINKDGAIVFQNKFDSSKPSRLLKIEMDEIGAGKYLGDYELFHYKPSQYSAVTHMQTSLFTISSIDFNLMSQFQLADVCKNSKQYPSDDKIRESFLEGVQWRVFRKQLVSKLQMEQKVPQSRDPQTMQKFQVSKDLKQFALKTLSFDKLMHNYLVGQNSKEDEQHNPLSELRLKSPKKQKPFFHNVDMGLKKLRQSLERNTDKRYILPKINPKVGSDIYNILITK